MLCTSNTTGPTDAHILVRVDDAYAYFAKVLYTSYDIQLGGIQKTNRADEALFLKTMYILCILFYGIVLLRYVVMMETTLI